MHLVAINKNGALFEHIQEEDFVDIRTMSKQIEVERYELGRKRIRVPVYEIYDVKAYDLIPFGFLYYIPNDAL